MVVDLQKNSQGIATFYLEPPVGKNIPQKQSHFRSYAQNEQILWSHDKAGIKIYMTRQEGNTCKVLIATGSISTDANQIILHIEPTYSQKIDPRLRDNVSFSLSPRR